MAFTTVENVANRQLRLEFQEGARRGQATLRVEAGSFVTVLLHAGPNNTLVVTPVVDAPDFNRARARLAFYNAMPDCPTGALSIMPRGRRCSRASPASRPARAPVLVTAQIRATCGERASAPCA